MALLRAAVLASSALGTTYVVDDADGLGLRWEGVGAISGGGATSKLLRDYNPKVASDILDYLFLPQVGRAALPLTAWVVPNPARPIQPHPQRQRTVRAVAVAAQSGDRLGHGRDGGGGVVAHALPL